MKRALSFAFLILTMFWVDGSALARCHKDSECTARPGGYCACGDSKGGGSCCYPGSGACALCNHDQVDEENLTLRERNELIAEAPELMNRIRAITNYSLPRR